MHRARWLPAEDAQPIQLYWIYGRAHTAYVYGAHVRGMRPNHADDTIVVGLAYDDDLQGGDGIDKFRIKIWDKDNGDAVVYDNQPGAEESEDPSTALGGGSIVIHESKE